MRKGPVERTADNTTSDAVHDYNMATANVDEANAHAAHTRNRRLAAGTSRAEAFSDGVFAIVITLLVLDLHPPKAPPGQLLSGLIQQWPTYFAYVTSYLYVGVVWLNHRAAFRRVQDCDKGLHWANLGVLFTSALLPFPTAILAQAMQNRNTTDTRTAVGVYALVGTFLCLSWWVFFHYLSRHPELVHDDVDEWFLAAERNRAFAGIMLYAAAGVLGYLVAPVIALVIFLVVPTFYGITSEGLFERPIAATLLSPRAVRSHKKNGK
jgi:uncharacterized membrane protein